jgi:predicted enzyme related to lactoylglutathione lyase
MLLFVQATRPKTHKNRLHLDLAGSRLAPDHQHAIQRLLDLGAASADIGQGAVSWTVLADPEGNEFCVMPEPGTDGHLVALCQDIVDVATQRPFWQAATGWSVADEGAWGFEMRTAAADGSWHGPRVLMGPPAVPKNGVNRWRFAVATDEATATATATGARTAATTTSVDPFRTPTPDRLGVLHADPEGNEFHLLGT